MLAFRRLMTVIRTSLQNVMKAIKGLVVMNVELFNDWSSTRNVDQTIVSIAEELRFLLQ
jgi:hypothetical protein